ncbi:MAG: DNA cytosine methyltransferase [Desulfobacterales bacterium]|nr:DNA cytosine methyltransferase [Desulfobacterales bacterium]
MKSKPVQVVDIFAGPGGLGEGFSAAGFNSRRYYNICLSIEKNIQAHETLELRSFFRQFALGRVPAEYYMHICGEITRYDLFRQFPQEAGIALQEAWLTELGKESPGTVDKRIKAALNRSEAWVLIGGPPCQAYSIIGRSRVKGINPDDPRVFLYREYLRILAYHAPPVFVMENVKGMLSSKIKGIPIFEQIHTDLENPSLALSALNMRQKGRLSHAKYKIFSLVKDIEKKNHFQDYIIQCEDYGIPQTRHRVILLGIREDIFSNAPGKLCMASQTVPVSMMLNSLPRVRSGLSKESDSKERWKERIHEILKQPWLSDIRNSGGDKVYEKLCSTIDKLKVPLKDRGNEFVLNQKKIEYMQDWFHDPNLQGACNHSTRGHMVSDLYRYLYAACFAHIHKRSPELNDFPVSLLPKHKNVKKALKGRNFADRFRVQVYNRPSTTVTSHLAKDGHYYIHPDPSQCRSMTVREAARLQTFPDNYYFCGSRTSQYTQVGNAVPPLLAKQIAEAILPIFQKTHKEDR